MPRPVEPLAFLGHDWSIGIANEAALKLRESSQFSAESYPAGMEYRHGPISIAAPGRAVWAFGEVPEGLAEEVRDTGAHFEHRDLDPMADLVRLHRLCLARAEAAGRDRPSGREREPAAIAGIRVEIRQHLVHPAELGVEHLLQSARRREGRAHPRPTPRTSTSTSSAVRLPVYL